MSVCAGCPEKNTCPRLGKAAVSHCGRYERLKSEAKGVERDTNAVVAERGSDYGHPLDHHGKVAEAYMVITGDGVVSKAEHVEVLWTLDKLVRMQHNDFCDSPANRDASTDVGGYGDFCLKAVWDKRKADPDDQPIPFVLVEPVEE